MSDWHFLVVWILIPDEDDVSQVQIYRIVKIADNYFSSLFTTQQIKLTARAKLDTRIRRATDTLKQDVCTLLHTQRHDTRSILGYMW